MSEGEKTQYEKVAQGMVDPKTLESATRNKIMTMLDIETRIKNIGYKKIMEESSVATLMKDANISP